MKIPKLIFSSLSNFERKLFIALFVLFLIAVASRGVIAINKNSNFVPVKGGYYKEGVVGQPTALNPIISDKSVDQALGSLVYATIEDLKSNIEVKNGAKTYILKLKEDLKWSDDKPLTSDDVVFTIKTIQNPEIQSPYYKTWKGVVIERISELQIKFTLPGPYVYFENNINDLPVIPKHIFGEIPASNIRLSSYNLEPISSGPYVFKDFSKKRNGFITEYHFKTNNKFAGEKPYIKDFYFRFYKNDAELLSDFKTRKIDGFSLSGLPDERVKKLPKAVIEHVSIPRYYATFFNPKSTSILKNDEFRKALSVSIDRKELANEILSNDTKALNSLADLIKENPVLPPNKKEAKKIISEVKEDHEKELTFEIIVPEVDFIKETAEFIKEDWESIGIDNVQVVSLKSNDFHDAVIRERNYEAVIFGNVLKNSLDLFPFWHSSERFYPGFNLSFYSNDKVDTILENIRQTEDEEKRKQEFLKASKIIHDDYPAVFLYSLPYTYVHHERLYGFEVSSDISSASDRFESINKWYVSRARVIKEDNTNTASTAN
ncbi:MAG TPA: ABC transporter substrate-binding protein [Candidatus Paceibacterota bacterium]|nr:ABC transporter substrate-binding protein [Candidatus Paceibacterota bacterium]